MRCLTPEDKIIANWQGDLDKPVVSICCITYNHESYIEDALEGFLIQETDFAFEVLIHDDASTDRTAEIIREYMAAYPRIIKSVFQSQNVWSKGVRFISPRFLFPIASGEFICLCEGDDYWVDKKKLQIQKDFLDNNKDYVICYTNIIPFDDSGNLDIDFAGSTHDLSVNDLRMAKPIYTLTTMFRNKIKEFPGEVSFSIYGDRFLWYLLSSYGKGKYLSGISPSMYRVGAQGIHSKMGKRFQLYETMKLYLAFFSVSVKENEGLRAFVYMLMAIKIWIRLVARIY